MKIAAVSDLHGNLITIKDECDVLVIAGDWSPLYIQQYYNPMMYWIEDEFLPWMSLINTDHIVFIPGNHDFVCTFLQFKSDLDTLLLKSGLSGKVHYLNDSSTKIMNKKFYGLPFTEGLNGWAFSSKYNVEYSFDEDTDVLITHQPPRIGDAGYISLYNKEFGSLDLRNKILKSNIDINICGHIHTGSHECQPVLLDNGKTAEIYNVSILDEDYRIAFKHTIIEI